MAAVVRGAGVGIRVKFDPKKLNALTKRLESFGKLRIEVGYYDGETYDDGTPVSAVASWHEFGTGNMPQRSFFRSALKENERAIKKALASASKEVVLGKLKPEKAAAQVARVMAKVVFKRLVGASSWATPLAPATIAAKGHSRILVETELLRDALAWRVVDGNTVVASGKAKNVRVNI